MTKSDFLDLIMLAFDAGAIKRLVFSKPRDTEIKKISCRLCVHRTRRLLAMELSMPGDTVSQKNIAGADIGATVLPLLDSYSQINLITTLGDAQMCVTKKGETAFLGADKLMKKLSAPAASFEEAIEALEKKKNYILSGDEEFLKRLGISSSDGRVHDKRQGKFRQINRFLEHIEDIYDKLPREGEIVIYDLCSGKSYLGFAVYHYLTEVKKREVEMLSADLKRDVILSCERLAMELGFSGMKFVCCDISQLPEEEKPDMVISLHACDIATDIVLENAVRLGASVILSTPCCHRYLSKRISSPALAFVTDYSHINSKLCDALTDGLRLARLASEGYTVSALELTAPENTPKNTLLRAVYNPKMTAEARQKARERYESALKLLLGDGASDYLSEFN